MLASFPSVKSLFVPPVGDKDGSKVTTVVATPGQGPDRPQEVSYTDTKVIGNGSFGVVYQAKLCDSGELVAIKKVLQDKRFKVSHVWKMCTQKGKGKQDVQTYQFIFVILFEFHPTQCDQHRQLPC